MEVSFFHASTLAAKKLSQSSVPKCGACGFYKSCKSPKMKPSGRGKKKILFVGEYPGKKDDKEGIPFSGLSGQLLRECLQRCGIKADRDCYFTNAVICAPPKVPDSKIISYCQPNLTNTIKELNPEIIIPLGGIAIKSLISSVWKDSVGTASKWVGWQIPCQQLNAWICPTWHPMYVVQAMKKQPVAGLWFARHLTDAISKPGPPWPDGLPNYQSQVRIELDDYAVAKVLGRWIKKGGPISFDYETDRLKPDHKDSRILSCAVCWKGKETIAYPWHGEAIQATSELLQSPLPKYGANIKFEERWTRRILGFSVRNWKWDGNLGAHWYDNRQGTKSVKFQSFVLMGEPGYDDHIDPYRNAPGSNKPNRLSEVDLETLLMYNGMDAVLEYHIARIQRSFRRK